eukprot:6206981-Pleurochrysis_carterae.AAC.7
MVDEREPAQLMLRLPRGLQYRVEDSANALSLMTTRGYTFSSASLSAEATPLCSHAPYTMVDIGTRLEPLRNTTYRKKKGSTAARKDMGSIANVVALVAAAEVVERRVAYPAIARERRHADGVMALRRRLLCAHALHEAYGGVGVVVLEERSERRLVDVRRADGLGRGLRCGDKARLVLAEPVASVVRRHTQPQGSARTGTGTGARARADVQSCTCLCLPPQSTEM